MKYFLFPAFILLTGCQSTLLSQDNTNEENNINQAEYIASTADINQALLIDENIDVIHPVDDVAFSLSSKESSLQNSDDVWQRIREQLTFNVSENNRIVAQRNWYVKHPSYLTRVAKRAEPFLYYIVEELEKNNVPIELALFPIVESAFDPFAYSHGRASGMWQFISATGKQYGLTQNWGYDGRREG